MCTNSNKHDGTDTVVSETTDPAGVGELATQVVISSSGNTSKESDISKVEIKTTDVLRLRGGGDPESEVSCDDGTNASTSGAMATDQDQGRNTVGLKASTVKSSIDSVALLKALHNHIGWIEQTVTLERAKKLTAGAADGINTRLKAVRDIYTDLCMENSRLQGVTQFSAAELKGLLDTFSKSQKEKSKEIEEVRLENLVLMERLETLEKEGPRSQSYADAVSNMDTTAAGTKERTAPSVPSKTAKTANKAKPVLELQIKSSMRNAVRLWPRHVSSWMCPRE